MKLPGTNSVDPIRGSVVLGIGSHPVTVIEEEKLEDTDERLKYRLRLESIGGDEPGARITDYWTVTANSAPYILGQIEAFGVELPGDEFEWIPLLGRNCTIIVRKEPGFKDPSQTFSVVKAYEKLIGEAAQLAAVANDFDAKPIDGATGAEDDIPF
jgi:hypothetical protein